MLTNGANFWPLLWTIVGAGAVLTVLACLLVSRFSPSWFHRTGQHQPARLLHLHVHHGHQPERLGKAA